MALFVSAPFQTVVFCIETTKAELSVSPETLFVPGARD